MSIEACRDHKCPNLDQGLKNPVKVSKEIPPGSLVFDPLTSNKKSSPKLMGIGEFNRLWGLNSKPEGMTMEEIEEIEGG